MHLYYDAFYVQLLSCPASFVILRGVCECDPLLSKSDLYIETCYVEQAAVKRPANSWISCGVILNTSQYKYSLSICPMNYCLQHSSALDLSNPDS